MLATLLVLSVLSVHDGDTLAVNLPCDIPLACQKMPIRLYGIDAPEITDNRPEVLIIAKAARSRLNELVSPAHKVEFRLLKRDARYRLDAEVFSDGVSVSDTLVAEGLARPYFGKGLRPW